MNNCCLRTWFSSNYKWIFHTLQTRFVIDRSSTKLAWQLLTNSFDFGYKRRKMSWDSTLCRLHSKSWSLGGSYMVALQAGGLFLFPSWWPIAFFSSSNVVRYVKSFPRYRWCSWLRRWWLFLLYSSNSLERLHGACLQIGGCETDES